MGHAPTEGGRFCISGSRVCTDNFLLSATTPDCIRGHPFFYHSRTAMAEVSMVWETTGAKALRLMGTCRKQVCRRNQLQFPLNLFPFGAWLDRIILQT